MVEIFLIIAAAVYLIYQVAFVVPARIKELDAKSATISLQLVELDRKLTELDNKITRQQHETGSI